MNLIKEYRKQPGTTKVSIVIALIGAVFTIPAFFDTTLFGVPGAVGLLLILIGAVFRAP